MTLTPGIGNDLLLNHNDYRLKQRHKEKRVEGHLFISILAYHLLHTIRYQLKQYQINGSWQTLRELLSTQTRITSTLQKCHLHAMLL